MRNFIFMISCAFLLASCAPGLNSDESVKDLISNSSKIDAAVAVVLNEFEKTKFTPDPNTGSRTKSNALDTYSYNFYRPLSKCVLGEIFTEVTYFAEEEFSWAAESGRYDLVVTFGDIAGNDLTSENRLEPTVQLSSPVRIQNSDKSALYDFKAAGVGRGNYYGGLKGSRRVPSLKYMMAYELAVDRAGRSLLLDTARQILENRPEIDRLLTVKARNP